MAEALLSVEEALAQVRQHAPSVIGATETLSLDAANNRVLAWPVLADRDQPPFARSTRDGYALKAKDASRPLRVIATVRAGDIYRGTINDGECVEIMTGAPVPADADTVIMLENVSRTGDEVRIPAEKYPKQGSNIVPPGAEAKAGAELLAKGTRLTSAEIALAASVGAVQLQVFRKPRVAILATGDELVDAAITPADHQIRNSNSHGIAALVREHGGEPILAPIVPDTLEAVEGAIEAARNADLLVMSGGVSAGKFDYVEAALAQFKAQFFFTGVKMQPGKPVVFGKLPAAGTHQEQMFFGLPGNPVSTQVTFLLYVAPLLRALGGEGEPQPRFAQATLAETIEVKPGLTRFLPAVLVPSLQSASVQLTGWQGSGDLNANARANCYAVVPADKSSLTAGSVITVLLR